MCKAVWGLLEVGRSPLTSWGTERFRSPVGVFRSPPPPS